MLPLIYSLLLLAGQDPSKPVTDQKFQANEIVNEFLYQATEGLVGLHMDTLTVQSFTLPLRNAKLGMFTINNDVVATGASIYNITHMERKGDAYITLGENEIRIDVGIHLEPMTATFKKLKFSLGFLSNEGPMRIESDGLDVSVEISLKLKDNTCKLWFEKADVTNIDYEKIVILPDGFFNQITDSAANAYLNANHPDLIVIANSFVKGMLNSMVQELDPCQYLPDYQI